LQGGTFHVIAVKRVAPRDNPERIQVEMGEQNGGLLIKMRIPPRPGQTSV
jgi:hypothetical protein